MTGEAARRADEAPPPLPRRVVLPSGARVTLAEDAARAAAQRARAEAPIARAFEILCAEGVLTFPPGAPAAGRMALRDAHVLRALLARSGIVEEAARTVACYNCGARLEVRPSAAFEPGPFVDGELDDPDLDAPFDFDRAHSIAEVPTEYGPATTMRLAPRSVDEAAVIASATAPAAITRAIVAALGIVQLGRERSALGIARVLEEADDDAWTAIAGVWESAHYSARLFAEVFCTCGARNEHHVPADRELDALAPVQPAAGERRARTGFPDPDTFEAWVRAATDRVFSRRGVRNVDVIVEMGVPDCDDGGEALLGSYAPPGPDPTGLGEHGPEIRIFYRTFAAEHQEDPSFDVRAEIEETLDHETEHHLYFLRGDDPMDDEERAVIAQERARVVGRAELVRRTARGAWDDVVGFVRGALPLLVLLAVLLFWQVCTGR